MFKKFLFLIFLVLFSGCNLRKNQQDSFTISCTTFPVYNFTKQLCNGLQGINVKYIISSEDDLHNFIPSTENIIEIINSDLFIYTGKEFETWISDNFLGSIRDSLNLSDSNIKLIINNNKIDLHWWNSFENAEKIIKLIKNKLSQNITFNKNIIENNSKNLLEKIKILKTRYNDFFNNVKEPVIFAGRFAFSYLFDEYKGKYFSIINSCRTKEQYSFKQIKTISNYINEHNIKYIYYSEDSDLSIINELLKWLKNDSISVEKLYSFHYPDNNFISNNYFLAYQENLNLLNKNTH